MGAVLSIKRNSWQRSGPAEIPRGPSEHNLSSRAGGLILTLIRPFLTVLCNHFVFVTGSSPTAAPTPCRSRQQEQAALVSSQLRAAAAAGGLGGTRRPKRKFEPLTELEAGPVKVAVLSAVGGAKASGAAGGGRD